MADLLLDTNTLLLFLIGNANRRALSPTSKHERLSAFTQDDLDAVNMACQSAKSMVTLPYILAETSNLMKIGKTASASETYGFLNFVKNADEISQKSVQIIKHPSVQKFGLTDSAIAQINRRGVKVMTVDYGLYGFLTKRGVEVENLRHRYKL